MVSKQDKDQDKESSHVWKMSTSASAHEVPCSAVGAEWWCYQL